jgi:hypothetical protein
VIGKIGVPRGERVAGLLYYLYGPGRCEEHTDPHLVAGWRHPAELEPPLRPGGSRDFRRLTGLLNQPHDALGPRGLARPVWHCALRAAPADRLLSDAEWAQVAADVMHRTGLSAGGQQDDGVRWVAVRHGGDHIHLVAMLARQDGRKPRLDFERYRVREACRAAEQRYGLRSTAPADRTAAARPSRAESEKARRRGQGEAPRVRLRRLVAAAAAGAGSEQEFFTRLAEAGVAARPRYSTTRPEQVTGYAVALAGDTSAAGDPVWYSGGKLAADLTWPKLCHRWQHPPAQPGPAAGPRAGWAQAAQAAHEAAGHLRQAAATGPQAAEDAAWAAADLLHAAAAATGTEALGQAADALARAARPRYGRLPAPGPAGDGLRQAARLISALAPARGDLVTLTLRLVIEIAALADALAALRQAQQRAAQAASARQAAAWAHTCCPPPGPAGPRVRTAADLARLGFPTRPGQAPPTPSQQPPPAPARARPPHRPTPPSRSR